MVIHFKNQENKQKIQQAIDTWIQTNNISIDKRELERTTYATDSYDTSFTQLIAQNIATRIFDMHKKNKYADNIIIQQGIGYAIKQSQNPPSIIHKK